mgnify:CR=1 FL=1
MMSTLSCFTDSHRRINWTETILVGALVLRVLIDWIGR